MTAFNSDAIYVFPCARKGGSSLASEYNFTHLSGRVSNKASYVIGEVNDILQVVLDGYYFEIKDEDIDSLCTKKLILWLETLPETDSTGGWAHVTRRVCGVEYDISENKWKKLQDLDNNGQFSALYAAGAGDPSDPSNSSNKISIETGLTYVCLDLNDKTNRVNNIHKSIEDKLTLGTYADGREYTTVKDYVEAAIAALKIGDYAKAANLTALAKRVTALEAKPFDTYATKTDVSNVEAKFAGYSTTAQMNKAIEDAIDGAITGADLGTYAKKSDLEAIYKAGVEGSEASGVLAIEIARVDGAIADLQTTVGNDESGLVKAVADNTAAISALKPDDYAIKTEVNAKFADYTTSADLATQMATKADAASVVAKDTFETFKTENTTAIEEAQSAAVAAAKVETEIMVDTKVQEAINGKEIYAIAFDANGGTGYMAPVICISSPYSLPEELSFIPPKGKKFQAWGLKTQNEEPGEYSITAIEDNKIDTTKTGNTIVYAMWAANTET